MSNYGKQQFLDNLEFAVSTIFNGGQLTDMRIGLEEIIEKSEVGDAVEWAFNKKLYLYSGYEDERWVHIADNKELLEAYRKRKGVE